MENNELSQEIIKETVRPMSKGTYTPISPKISNNLLYVLCCTLI